MRAAPKLSARGISGELCFVIRIKNKNKKPVLDQVISTNPYELRSESDDTHTVYTDKTVGLIFSFNF